MGTLTTLMVKRRPLSELVNSARSNSRLLSALSLDEDDIPLSRAFATPPQAIRLVGCSISSWPRRGPGQHLGGEDEILAVVPIKLLGLRKGTTNMQITARRGGDRRKRTWSCLTEFMHSIGRFGNQYTKVMINEATNSNRMCNPVRADGEGGTISRVTIF